MHTNNQYTKLAKWLGHAIKYNVMLGHYVFLTSSSWTEDGISWNDYKKYLESGEGRIGIENKLISIGVQYWIEKLNNIYIIKELCYSPIAGHFDIEKEEAIRCGETPEKALINLALFKIEQKEKYKEQATIINEECEKAKKKVIKMFKLKYKEKATDLCKEIIKFKGIRHS